MTRAKRRFVARWSSILGAFFATEQGRYISSEAQWTVRDNHTGQLLAYGSCA
jgi:hypothetical protein